MPFKNPEQMRACFAKHDPKWNCKKWLRHGGVPKSFKEYYESKIKEEKNTKNA